MNDSAETTRPLTSRERRLIHWMLEHGTPEAKQFVDQLARASATSWKCECGCASINLVVDGCPPPTGIMGIISDCVYGGDGYDCGIIVFQRGGVLAGLEVFGYANDPPKVLPHPDELQSLSEPPPGHLPADGPHH